MSKLDWVLVYLGVLVARVASQDAANLTSQDLNTTTAGLCASTNLSSFVVTNETERSAEALYY